MDTSSKQNITDVHSAIVDLAKDEYDKFIRFAFIIVKDTHSSEDCVQEAFFTALNKCHHFKGNSSLHTWFTTILLNQCRTYLRSKWRRSVSPTQSVPDYIEADFTEQLVIKSLLTECLLKMPEKYRIPLYLHYYEDMATEEISIITNIEPSTCRVQLLRGRKKLKDLFERGNKE